MSRVISIHQPNFFPWLGYFDKIARSEAFIFLDDVQFQKTGGTWSNRVKLILAGEPRWVTAPIERSYHGVRKINEIRFKDGEQWRTKFLRAIEQNYCRHPFFDEVICSIKPLILDVESNIAAYNDRAIVAIATILGIPKERFLWSSRLHKAGSSNSLLVSLTHSAGGDTYMCGGGADGYQDEGVFTEAGVALIRQSFAHPVYAQHGASEFSPGLSIIDPLMNLGIRGVSRLLNIAG